jgi:hypothetical protein
MYVHLAKSVHENLTNKTEPDVFRTRTDTRNSGDLKPAIRVDNIDRFKNLEKNEEEKPNRNLESVKHDSPTMMTV